MRTIACVLVLSGALSAFAEGPGSQLRTTPEIPQATPMPTNPVRPDPKRCENLTQEQRQQCLAELRSPTPRSNGPQSIGGGAGASGTGSGTTGGATFGGSAPR